MANTRQCAIVIPLGGWFNKTPRIWYGPNFQFQDSKVYWSLGSFRMTYDGSITESTVTIKTRHGEEANLFVSYALDLFNQMMADDKTPPVKPLGFAFFRSMRNEVEFGEKSESLKAILRETVERMDKTRRFVKSKEGAALREWLEEQLVKFLPADKAKEPEDEAAA
jgi:hypothetical protein